MFSSMSAITVLLRNHLFLIKCCVGFIQLHVSLLDILLLKFYALILILYAKINGTYYAG